MEHRARPFGGTPGKTQELPERFMCKTKAGIVTQVQAPREPSAALHREMTWSKGGGSEIDRSHKPLVPVSARSSCINRQTFSGLGKHLKFQTDLGDGRAIGGQGPSRCWLLSRRKPEAENDRQKCTCNHAESGEAQ